MPIDTKAYREKDTEALSKELAALQRQLFDLRTQSVIEKLDDSSLIKKSRRDIARLKTLLRQRQLASASA